MNWPVKGMDIYGIKNNNFVKEVKWSLTYDKDFYDLSLLFYELGYTLFNEILDDNTDHEKTDMCLYTAIMLIRQSIELMLKALIFKKYPSKIRGNKTIIMNAFHNYKHDLSDLFGFYCQDITLPISSSEKDWLNNYFKNISIDDNQSQTFRYPFSEEFFKKYFNKFISVHKTGNNLIIAFKILKNIYLCNNETVNLPSNCDFLIESSSGLTDCYMWDVGFGDRFYKHIRGYSLSINMLVDKCDNNKYFYIYLFLYRNLIELYLKRICNVISKMNGKRCAYWHEITRMWDYFLNNYNTENADEIVIVGDELKKIFNIDKNSDAFRYPVDLNLCYHCNNKTFDVSNTLDCYSKICSFLDCVLMQVESDYDSFCDMCSEIESV